MTPAEGAELVSGTEKTWKLASSDERSVMQVPMSQPSFGPETVYYVPIEFVNGYGPAYPEAPVSLNGDIHTNAAPGIQESTTPPGEGTALKDSIPPAELKRLVRQQFEYYFSRENLANDAYLVSQMDGDQFVPIATVARFNQIKKLTSDMGLIVDAIRESPYIQLNENGEKVRANMKRCIVILREIPDTTPVKEIEALFDSEKCPRWTNCEFAHNNSWYVTFESEEHAQKAYQYLREDVKTFKGRPIMARIKAKTLLSRTVFLPKNGVRSNTQPLDSSPAQQPIAPRPFSTITVPTPVLTAQQAYPPVYSPNNIIPAPWLGPRQQFFTPEVYPQAAPFQTSLAKGNKGINTVVTRPFIQANKSRPQPKTFTREQNERSLDKEERSPGYRRSAQQHISNGPINLYRKEIDIPHRRQNLRNKKNEEGPRFQRLKQERERRQFEQQARKEEEDMLHLDLAPENFPALPSPSSPNDKAQASRTSSLKELATHALEQVQTEAKIKDDKEELPLPSSEKDTSSTKSETSPTIPSASFAESLSVSTKPSYAQMAQKPLTKLNQQHAVKDSNPQLTANSDLGKNSPSQSEGAAASQQRKIQGTSSPKPQRQQRPAKAAPEPPKGAAAAGGQKGTPPTSNSNDSTGASAKTSKDSYAARSLQNVPPAARPQSERVRSQPPRPSSAPPQKSPTQSTETTSLPSLSQKGNGGYQNKTGNRQSKNQAWRVQSNAVKTRDDSSIKVKVSEVPHKDETAEDNRSI